MTKRKERWEAVDMEEERKRNELLIQTRNQNSPGIH